jgi:hypothetical protein
MENHDEMAVPHTVTNVEGQRAVWIAGPTCVRHEVVGEVHYPEQMQRVTAWVRGRTDAVVVGWLTPEAHGGGDPHVVAVWVLGGKVGYLPRELAVRWQPLVVHLGARHGAAIACQATLDPPSAANQGGYGIVLWLPVLPAPRPTTAPPMSSSIVAWLRSPAADQPQPAPSQRSPVSSPLVPPPSVSSSSSRQAAAVVAPPPSAHHPSSEDLAKLRAEIEAAQRELASVEEALDIQSFGFYKPRYGFESSAQYVARLATIREQQKRMIADDKAAPCETQWTVGGSAAEGRKMVKQQAKLMLRAFNGESDAAIAKVKYDNAVTLEERITKAYEAVNKLGEVQRVFIAQRYLELKLAELHLVHEHREKVQQEKEEQKRIKEQMREEQRAQAEIERAKAEAEREEDVSKKALEKARAELAVSMAADKQHEKLEALVTRLENELKEALDRKAKAIARAQLTKSGHVYVLSNIGSFGEGVYKIGMTRRLDPLDRVDELGDASVPFPFDVHAIIYAEDAPGLENKLHRAFTDRRLNLVNARKEYFRVTLDEIRAEVEKVHGLVTFVLVPPAEEYRKTLAAVAVPEEERGALELPAEELAPVEDDG